MSKSFINPEGYGTPIVGLFDGYGKPLLYSPVVEYEDNNESHYVISQCKIKEDEEDGVSCDVTIETNNTELIDSPYFTKGASLQISMGYLTKKGPKFAPPYKLVLKDFKANYLDKIVFILSLVDALTYSSISKDDDEMVNPLDLVQDEVDDLRKEVKEIEDRSDLDSLLKKLQKIKDNIRIRNEVIGEFNYEVTGITGLGSYTMRFKSLDELKEFIRESDDEKYKKADDWILIRDFGKKWSGIRALGARLGLFRSPLKDLFGYSFGYKDEGRDEWLNKLEELGIMDIVRQRAIKLDKAPRNLLSDTEFMDKVLAELTENLSLPLIEQDVNLSVEMNLQKVLNEQPGGPYIISDTGDSKGTKIQAGRTFDRKPFMKLDYKGGTGDLIDVKFSSDFYSAAITSTQALNVDGEDGTLNHNTEFVYADDGTVKRDPKEISSFMDGALNTIQNNIATGNKQPVDLKGFIDRPVQTFYRPGGSYAESSVAPPRLKADGTYTAAIDATAVSMPPSMRSVYASKPYTLEQIQNEIDNRRTEQNLRQIMADARIVGRPDIRTGYIFDMRGVAKKLVGNYYCLAVEHFITPDNGFITSLELGKIPVPEQISSVIGTDIPEINDQGALYLRVIKTGRVITYRDGSNKRAINQQYIIKGVNEDGDIEFYTYDGKPYTSIIQSDSLKFTPIDATLKFGALSPFDMAKDPIDPSKPQNQPASNKAPIKKQTNQQNREENE